jgi:hypothetical protein
VVPGVTAAIVDDPSVFCDNHSTCGGLYLGRGNLIKTREAARARGWAFYEGFNLDNTRKMSVSLCPGCAQTERRKLPKAGMPLEGQISLFEEQ